MEIKLRMSKRFVAWLSLALVALVALGMVACGSLYSPNSDGLMLVGSQGSALIETYTFNLANGHISSISNPPSDTSLDTCVLPGLPGSMVVDTSGNFAYVILTANSTCPGSKTGIASFPISSSGTIGTTPTTLTMNTTTATVTALVDECGTQVPVPVTVTAPVVPVSMAIDKAGKFLFVADTTTTATAPTVNYTCGGSGQTATPIVSVPGTVSVFTISSGTLTEVSGSPFSVPPTEMAANIVSVAATPTVFPSIGINGVQNSACTSQNTPAPSQQFLYAADFENNVVWEFGVNMSTGVLSGTGSTNTILSFAAGTQPAGVAVDPCNRFVFVSNFQSNNISAYTICNGSSTSAPPPACPASPATPNGSLVAVSGPPSSPYSLPGNANGPGPMVVDPFGNYLYVLEGTTVGIAGSITPFQISTVSGALTSKGIVATGAGPVSIAIRGDDNWLFVANYVAGTVSQYAIIPNTGVLSPQPVVQTDSYPWGVAVK
jgi:hypothetical protein